jgi:hypothetical protein
MISGSTLLGAFSESLLHTRISKWREGYVVCVSLMYFKRSALTGQSVLFARRLPLQFAHLILKCVAGSTFFIFYSMLLAVASVAFGPVQNLSLYSGFTCVLFANQR